MQPALQKRKTDQPKVASQSKWLAACKDLLTEEKELTRRRDALSAERRELPRVKVEKNYVFDDPSGKESPYSLGHTSALFAGSLDSCWHSSLSKKYAADRERTNFRGTPKYLNLETPVIKLCLQEEGI